jgi:hypothetical protein
LVIFGGEDHKTGQEQDNETEPIARRQVTISYDATDSFTASVGSTEDFFGGAFET